MNCRSAEHAMDRALDEAIPGARTEELRAHLDRCPGCRRQWEALQAAEAVLRVPRPAPAPEDLLADFRRRLDAERPVALPTPARPWLSWLWPAGSVAAAGLAAALAVTFNLPGTFSPPSPPQTQLGSGARGDGASPAPAPAVPLAKRKPAPSTPGEAGISSRMAVVPGSKSEPERLLRRSAEALSMPAPVTGPRVKQGSARPETLSDLAAGSVPAKPLATPSQLSLHRGLGSKARTPSQGAAAFGVYEGPRSSQVAEAEKAPAAPIVPSPLSLPFARKSLGEGARNLSQLSQASPGVVSDLYKVAGKKADNADRFGSNADRPSRGRQDEVNFRAPGGSSGGFGGGHPTSLAAVDKAEHLYFYDAEIRQPRELDVSPAVLTALQRPVEVQLQGETLAGAVRQLSEAADVVLSYDPRVGGVAVNVATPDLQAPLWIVLQEVAQQSNLQIVPRDNQLELRPAGPVLGKVFTEVLKQDIAPSAPAGPAAPATLGVPSQAPRGGVAGAPAPPPAATPAPAGIAGTQRYRLEPQALTRANKPSAAPERRFGPAFKAPKQAEKKEKTALRRDTLFALAEREQAADRAAPDRRVWPDQWGRLPEWGFALPTPEALPAEAAGSNEAQLSESRIAGTRAKANAAESKAPSRPIRPPVPSRTKPRRSRPR